MSRSVDTKVVQMQFDNKQFEEGAQETMSTLDKLKSKLDFSDTSSSLEGLKQASRNFNLSGVEAAISTVTNSFSAMEIVGITAIANLTNKAVDMVTGAMTKITSSIIQGGKARAQNIAAAKFQLKGLGIAWEEISEDIDYGVKDTAYGLDAAAKIAAQLSASGIKVGKEMKTALRGISGVAAMTNSTYEEIGYVYASIAGSNRVYAQHMLSLSTRGLNAWATLAKYLNKTEAEVHDLVQKGEIDFKTFSKAMDSTFGEHAKDANSTFTGSLSNVKAALSRIGEKFYTPYFDAMIGVLNSARKSIDKFKDSLVGTKIIDDYTNALNNLAKKTSKVIDGFDYSWLTILKDDVFALGKIIKAWIYPVVKELPQLLGRFTILKDLRKTVEQLIDSVNKSSAFLSNTERFARWADIFRSVHNVLQGLWNVLKFIVIEFRNVLRPFNQTKKLSSELSSKILDLTDKFSKWSASLMTSKDAINKAQAFIGGFVNVLSSIGTSITKILSKALDFVEPLINVLMSIGDTVLNLATRLMSGVKPIKSFNLALIDSRKIAEQVSNLFSKLKGVVDSLVEKVKEGINTIKSSFNFDLSATKFMGALNAGLLLQAIMMVQSFATDLKRLMLEFKPVFITTLKNTLATLRVTLLAYQDSLNAGVLKNIAVSIAILAGAVFVLAAINPEKLLAACAALAVVGKLLTSFTKSLKGMLTGKDAAKDAAELFAIASAMVIMSSALVVLSIAVALLGLLPTEMLIKGLGAVALIFYMFSIVIKTALNTKLQPLQILTLMALLSEVLELAIAVFVIGGAIALLGSLDIGTLLKGFAAVAAIFGGLYLFAKYGKDLTFSPKFAIQLIGIAFAVQMLATAMVILGAAAVLLSVIPIDKMIPVFFGTVLMITALAVALNSMGSISAKVLAGAGAALILSIAVGILAGALIAISAIKADKLWSSFSVLSSTIIVMAIALLALSRVSLKSLVGATAMIIVAAAITILVPALLALASIPADELKKVMTALIVGLIMLAGYALVAGAVAGPLYLLAGALVLFGTAVTLAGAGIFLLATGLAALVGLGSAGLTMFGSVILEFIALIPELFRQIGVGFIEFLTTLSENFFAITHIFGDFLVNLLEMIAEYAPQFVEAGMDIITSLIGALTEKLPELTLALFGLVVGLINSVAEAISKGSDEIIDAVTSLVISLLELIIKVFTQGLPSLFKKGKEMIGNMIDGADEEKDDLAKEAKGISTNAANGLKDTVGSWKESGKNAVGGFVSGMKDSLPDVSSMSTLVGDTALDGLKGSLQIHSPSKAFRKLGDYSGEGFLIGLKDYIGKIGRSTYSMGSSALDSLRTAIDKSSDYLGKDFDTEPKLTPVVDLTNVRAAEASIDSIFSNRKAIGVQASINSHSTQAEANKESIDHLAGILNGIQVGIDGKGNGDLSTILREALDGCGVYMDGNKVGKLVTRSQLNTARASGVR